MTIILNKRPHRLTVLGLFIAAACGTSESLEPQDARQNALAIDVTADTDSYAVDDAPTIRVLITNVTKHPVRIPQQMIPTAGFAEDIFSVSVNGSPVHYIGSSQTHIPTKKDELIALEPGETIGGAIDLSRLYDMKTTGAYTVGVEVEAYRLLEGGAMAGQPGMATRIIDDQRTDMIRSNTIDLDIAGRDAIQKKSTHATRNADTVRLGVFDGCSNSQEKKVKAAIRDAHRWASQANKYLRNPDDKEVREHYETFFGKFSDKRFIRVKWIFAQIEKQLRRSNYVFVCEKKAEGTRSTKVDPTSPTKKLQLYPRFFSKNKVGQVAAVVAAATRFKDAGKTRDKIPGTASGITLSKVKDYAEKNPSGAIENATSYAFFCAELHKGTNDGEGEDGEGEGGDSTSDPRCSASGGVSQSLWLWSILFGALVVRRYRGVSKVYSAQ